jgi:predicted permease
MNQIGPGYFATLGVPIVAGRDFRLTDNRVIKRTDVTDDFDTTPTTVIINEKFAQKFFAARNPVGMHLGFGTDPGTHTDMEIIGVVKDIKYTNLRDEIPIQAYVPYMNSPYLGGMTIYVRTAGEPNQLMSSVRAKMRDLDANVPIYAIRTMDEQISNSLSTERMIASLSTVFGFVATVLAIIGLYGVMSYSVAQRTREIGIRMALGAQRSQVLNKVLREAGAMLAIGIAIGVFASLLSASLFTDMLYGTGARNPMVLALVSSIAAIAGLIAAFLPARRAASVDPMQALRSD